MFMPDPPKKEEPLREGRWRLIQKLDGWRSLYEECYYDENGNLVRLTTRRVYMGDQLEAEFSVNSKGEKDGKYTEYDSQGDVIKRCYYSEGLLDGIYAEYNQGKEKFSVPYENGRVIGQKILRDDNGEVVGYEIHGETGILEKGDVQALPEKEGEGEGPTKIPQPIGFGMPSIASKKPTNEKKTPVIVGRKKHKDLTYGGNTR